MTFDEIRLAICNACEFNIGGECVLCGCIVADKVKKELESCPAVPKRWDIYDPNVKVAQVVDQPPEQQSSAPTDQRICIPCQARSR